MEPFRSLTTSDAPVENSTNINTHLEHLEDLIWDFGKEGLNDAADLLSGVIESLNVGSDRYALSIKYDGAPAVVSGINPENNKFFVGTKSVFSAKTPKIIYTEEDIQKFYPDEPGLQKKLRACLQYLPQLGYREILQGDLLYTDDIEEKDIDGKKYVTFTPNTITYAIESKSNIASRIKNSKLGIAFHTVYSGDTLQTLKATFEIWAVNLKRDPDVIIFRSELNPKTVISIQVADEVFDKLDTVRMMEIPDVPGNISELAKQHYNFLVRNSNTEEASVESFKKYIDKKFSDDAQKLKQTKNKILKIGAGKKIIEQIDSLRLEPIYKAIRILSETKNLVLKQLSEVMQINTFLRNNSGELHKTGHEGFVGIDLKSGKAVKLVDRMEFSKANFTLPKSWKK